VRFPLRSTTIAVCLSTIALGCGAASPDSEEIPIVIDDGGQEAGDDTARVVADTAPHDGTTTLDAKDADGAATDSLTIDGKPAETATDTAVDHCTGVATASFEPPTTCSGPSGYTTKEIPPNHVYASSWFGCYRKTDGTIYKDPTDNCLFACGNKGLCSASATGPECEATLQWFAADADRYGCGGRIRVTLDRGPNCKTVEQAYGAPTLDMSHPAITYLFEGKTYGVSDKKRVLVEAVADTTKLGPE
jgi:hypothetical protein